MQLPRVRFTVRGMMVVVAALAFDMSLAQWDYRLSILYLLITSILLIFWVVCTISL